jgi:polynucleotide 5'-kinase involved in rRNA processing
LDNNSVAFHAYYTPVLKEEPEKVANLIRVIKASTRGSNREEKLRRFVEPARGTLGEAMSPQHHVVFGRRGSGKTSLLRKAEQELLQSGSPVAFVDLDVYKRQTFPNLIASILREAFAQYREQARNITGASKSTIVSRLDEE